MELQQLREPVRGDPALAQGTVIDVARQIVGVRRPGGLSHFEIRHGLNLADLARVERSVGAG
jgi:hypothetical protein